MRAPSLSSHFGSKNAFGLHVHTAVRWVTYARRDWTDYLAGRAAEQKDRGRVNHLKGALAMPAEAMTSMTQYAYVLRWAGAWR
jgi:hypothetical protein